MMISKLDEFKKGSLISIITESKKEHKGLFLSSDKHFTRLFPLIRYSVSYCNGTILTLANEDIVEVKRTRLPKGVLDDLKEVFKDYLEIEEINRQIRELKHRVDEINTRKNKKHADVQTKYVMLSKSTDPYILAKEISDKVKDKLDESVRNNTFVYATNDKNGVYLVVELSKYVRRFFNKEDYVASQEFNAYGSDNLIKKFNPNWNLVDFKKISKNIETIISTDLHDKGTVSIDTQVKINMKDVSNDINFLIDQLIKGIKSNKRNFMDSQSYYF